MWLPVPEFDLEKLATMKSRDQYNCLVEEPYYGAPQMGYIAKTDMLQLTLHTAARNYLSSLEDYLSLLEDYLELCYVAIQPR